MNEYSFLELVKKESYVFFYGIKYFMDDIEKGNVVIGRVPPQDVELENCVLGALMLEADSIVSVVDILYPEVFYNRANRLVYTAILDLFKKNSPIDIKTVINQLSKNGKLEEVGGAYYVQSLTDRVVSAANIEYHTILITEYAIKRELISIATAIEKRAYDNTIEVSKLLDDAESKLFSIASENLKRNYYDIKTLLAKEIVEIKKRRENKSGITGVPSGFPALDFLTAGWQKSDLIIVAARPGMGKTAFMLSILRNAAIENRIPVAFFSLEMSSSQLVTRLMSSEAEVRSGQFRKGQLDDEAIKKIVAKTERLSSAPIFIDDTPALSMFELRTKCRKLKLQHNVQLIIVDYLQLLTSDSRKTTFNREQEIAYISRSLKSLAKELDVPIITPSQLSRAVEVRGGDKRPVLSDLRESGAIEQDADIVMFLYRPEYYGITEDEFGNDNKGLTQVIISKHRNGPLETVVIKFVGEYVKFVNV